MATILLLPRDARPAEPFPLVHISAGLDNNGDPLIDGRDVVWVGHDGNGYAVYHYDIQTTTRARVTDYVLGSLGGIALDDRKLVWEYQGLHYRNLANADTMTITSNPYAIKPEISGADVVWIEGRAIDSLNRVMHFHLDSQSGGQIDGYGMHNEMAISDSQVAWDARVGAGPETSEVFHYNLQSAVATRLTNNSIPDQYPSISGDRIIWQIHDVENTAEIFARVIGNASNDRLTNNGEADRVPRVSGDYAVWQAGRSNGAFSDVVIHDFVNGQLMPLTISGGYPELYGQPFIATDSVTWEGLSTGSGTSSEIFFWDISSGHGVQVTDNAFRDVHPVVSGYAIAFLREEPNFSNQWQAYLTAVPEPIAVVTLVGGMLVLIARRERPSKKA